MSSNSILLCVLTDSVSLVIIFSDGALGELFTGLLMIRVEFKSLFEGLTSSLLLILALLVDEDETELVVSIRVMVVPAEAGAEIQLSVILVTLIVVGSRQVEVALS